MAASGSIPEQGRPPEAVNDNEITDVNCNVERVRLLKEGACPKITSKSESCKETLRKVFFAKKSPVKKCEDAAIKTVSGTVDATPPARAKSKKTDEGGIKTVSGAVDKDAPVRAKNRNSFHQDVEEALSSLLWQPYEYQNKTGSDSTKEYRDKSGERNNYENKIGLMSNYEYQNKSGTSGYYTYQNKSCFNSFEYQLKDGIASYEYPHKYSLNSFEYQNKCASNSHQNKNCLNPYEIKHKLEYQNKSGFEYKNKDRINSYEHQNDSGFNSLKYQNANGVTSNLYQNKIGINTCEYLKSDSSSSQSNEKINPVNTCEYQYQCNFSENKNTNSCESQSEGNIGECRNQRLCEYQNDCTESCGCAKSCGYKNDYSKYQSNNLCELQNETGKSCEYQSTNLCDLQNAIIKSCEYQDQCIKLCEYQDKGCSANLSDSCEYLNNFGTDSSSSWSECQNKIGVDCNLSTFESRNGNVITGCNPSTCEYQVKGSGLSFCAGGNKSDFEYRVNCRIKSASSTSSSCSSLEDLNNGEEKRHGNAADLHLLVNNLQVNLLSQSATVRRSRDERWCSGVCVPSLGAVSSVEECAGAGGRSNGRCDEKGPMRVEILQQQQPGSANVVRTAENGVVSVVGANQTLSMNQNQVNRNNGVLSRNLSSVNVVGLPSSNHPRQGSVPSSTNSAGRGLLVPNHSRNTSEPFRASVNNNNVQFNHPRNGSEPAVAPFRPAASVNSNTVSILNQQRYAGNTNASVHLRSSSVPYQQQQPQVNLNLTHQRNPSDVNARANRVPLNVSNVNVNYYRAVPVNVVSAVPTIQCFNSTTNSSSDANNVSNVNIVQAMPVGAAHTLPVPTSIQNYSHPQFSTAIPHQNFSNLNLLPTLSNATTSTSTCTEVIVHSSHDPVQQIPEVRTRTFTSTEAQTDDTLNPESGNSTTREQRRRERRERRHQRRLNNANHNHRHAANNQNGNRVENGTNTNTPENNSSTQTERLPDLLNNTLPPPYTTVPGGVQQVVPQSTMVQPPPPPPPLVQGNLMVPPGTIVQSMVPNNIVPTGLIPFHPQIVPGQVPLVQAAGPVPVPVPSPTGFRFPFPASGFRRSRYSEEPPKSCCGLLAWRPGSLRWFIALIALVAVCCVLVGTALGAMRPSGRDHLTVSLLMIGVGIILVTVSGVAWRLTSHDSSTCRSMLGLGSTESVEVCPRRFVPRLPPSYGRPHHPYAAMMYPEFQYRPPPPSYQASMQEYRLRLLLLDRGNTPQIQAGIQNAVSPPPTYRSHSGSLLRAPLSNRRDLSQSEYSCPPSYRSQTSSSRPATIMQNNSIIHSREQSLSLSESNNGGSVVNVVNILSTNDEDIALDNITLDSLKLEPDQEINPLKLSPKIDLETEGNLVTIVQTDDRNPVIVTVSGSSQADNCNQVQITEIPSEMEILAHL